MLDSRTNEWLSKLQAKGPELVSLALAALIALQLGSVIVSWVGGRVKSPQPVLVPRPAQPRPHAGVDVRSVVSAHLFGIATVDPASQDPANAPLSSANLVLAGTIASQDPKHGIAIISDGGPSKVYSVGSNVNGATLHSVFLDHVILDRAGTLETLVLPRLLGGRSAAPVRRTPGADPRTIAAVENIRHLVQQDPGILDQVMRTVASYDNVAGKLRGFRAYPGRNRAIFNRLGLKAGDLVTAINGTLLDDPQHSQEVFNTIQTSDRVTVTVERNGQKQDITLNIAQVAAQATKDLETEPGATAAAPNGGSPSASASGGSGATTANPQGPPSTTENPNEP